MKPILKILLLCIICFLLLINTAYCQAPKMSASFLKQKDWGFLPNRGQLANEHGDVLTDIKYYGHQGGVYLYCRPGKLSFVFTKVEKGQSGICEATGQASLPKGLKEENHENDKIYTSRADMVLIGANPNAQIIATGQQEYYENYYLAHTTMKGITNVHAYKTLTYQNIYPHIDLVLHSCTQGIKYEYVVHPGGKVSDIQMQWYGLAKAQLMAKGGISYSMHLNKNKIGMKESAPVSFTTKSKVASSFVKKGNIVSFKVGKYDGNAVLTIDPEISWATYFGGEAAETSSKVKTDIFSNVYICGYTNSFTGIATAGAYQSSYLGYFDVFLAKFDYFGKFIWATYYGGSNEDYTSGMAIDAKGNIYIGCSSYSSDLASSGAYQSKNAGGIDVLLAKFNTAGSLVWATYFGGEAYEYTGDIALDASQNIYIIGHTRSLNGIATTGAYKTDINPNYEHAFFAKFNTSGGLVWATYFGLDFVNTWGTDIGIDAAGNVIITGETKSEGTNPNNYIGLATSGAYQTYNKGSEDVFLAKFSDNGTLLWATYFGGNRDEQASGLSIDKSGNIYITGNTTSIGIGQPGAYQLLIGGDNDAFLAKFSNSGSLTWFTYFGGQSVDIASDIALDPSENIYITGSTTSNTGIASIGALQSNMGGIQDAFIAIFNNKGNLNWASYLGGESLDLGTGICLNKQGDIYMGMYSASTSMATAGAHQLTNDSNSIDALIVKLSYPYNNDAGLTAITGLGARGCANNKIVLTAQIKNFGTKTLNTVIINYKDNGIQQKGYLWTGTLAVGGIAKINFDSLYLPEGFHTLSVYTTMPNGKEDSVRVNDTLTIKYRSTPAPSTAWSITKNGMAYSFHALDSSLGKYYYYWELEDGFHYSGYSFSHSFPENKLYKVKFVATNTFGCATEHDTTLDETGLENITIFPNPFKGKAIVHFKVPEDTKVNIAIANISGQFLYSVLDENLIAGVYEIALDTEAKLSAGTYFVIVTIGKQHKILKVVLMGR